MPGIQFCVYLPCCQHRGRERALVGAISVITNLRVDLRLKLYSTLGPDSLDTADRNIHLGLVQGQTFPCCTGHFLTSHFIFYHHPSQYPSVRMNIFIMLLQATIIRNYFVKTQTSVASFGPPDLSIIFSNGMYLEVSPL